jgi:hypothetical protein
VSLESAEHCAKLLIIRKRREAESRVRETQSELNMYQVG